MKSLHYVLENLALRKQAMQKSTYNYDIASNAVNGILYGIIEYSETQGGDNQWWRVDLGSLQSVKLIELYSRNRYRKSKICVKTYNADQLIELMWAKGLMNA